VCVCVCVCVCVYIQKACNHNKGQENCRKFIHSFILYQLFLFISRTEICAITVLRLSSVLLLLLFLFYCYYYYITATAYADTTATTLTTNTTTITTAAAIMQRLCAI
jgi:hypothetical protein